MQISAIIKSIQDIMRKDTGVDGDAQRISQLGWMIFLKIFDDNEKQLALMDPNYKSVIPKQLQWRSWAENDEGITGDDLVDFVNNSLFKGLKELPADEGSDPRNLIVREVFRDAYNYMKSGTLIRQVINKLDEIDFNKMAERHLMNDVYEQILKDLQSAGNAGEYYTPRAVTQFIVDMVNPRLGERILDPACGTGGFLISALEYIRTNDVKTAADEDILKSSLFGIEKKPLPHLLCTTNMILHGIDVPSNIRHDNSLTRPYRDYSEKDRVDVIITNPPFGGIEEDGIETNFPKTYQTRETADLFLVLIMQLLKNGGQAGIVLPDGTLFGEGIKTKIKEKLLEECNLHTIIRLPKGVFAPYTSINTNLLFFTKGEPTKEIWYFEHPYPAGVKSYNKTKPINIKEFALEKAWWNNRIENEFAWKVSVEELKSKNYNLDIKNPNRLSAPTESLSSTEIFKLLDNNLNKTTNFLTQIKMRLRKQDFKNATDKIQSFIQNNVSLLPLSSEQKELIKQLKRAIFLDAIQGKLVPHKPSYGNAKDLLEMINSDNEKSQGKENATKQNILSRINSEEVPFNIPDNWIWAKLGNVSHVQTGKKDANQGNKNGNYNFYTCAIEPILSSSYSFEGESLILPGNGANVGFVRYVNEKFEAYQRTYVVNNFLYVDPKYIYICLLARWDTSLGRQYGSAINYIKLGNVTDFLIPLAPLKEQHEIVKEVEYLIRICDIQQQNISDIKENIGKLNHATLLEEFSSELSF